MSWHFSRALVEAYSGANSSDGAAFARWKSMPTAPDDSSSGKMKATCHVSPFGMMFVPSTDALGAELLRWALEDSRAKASAFPVTGQGWITKSLGSGAIKPASLAKLDSLTSGLKTHQRSLFGEGFESLESLPRWGMIVGGELYPLPTPSGLTEHRASITSESGSGLPERCVTPIKSDGKRGQQRAEKHGGKPARVATPQAHDSSPGNPERVGRFGTKHGGKNLNDEIAYRQIHRVPTPTSGFMNTINHDPYPGSRGRPALGALVKRAPTPTTQDASNNGPASQQERNTKPLNAEVGGPLNPDWVEWLMGWPVGWTDSKPLGTDRFRLWLNSHGIF